MKMLSIALATLPLMAVAAALAQTPVVPQDEDLLTRQERILSRSPHAHPGWTWMTESQAIFLLKARGFSDVSGIENESSFWRGKAIKDHASYHVAINRYTGLFMHVDKKSRESYAVAQQTQRDAAKASRTTLPTLNGPIAVPISQTAPTALTSGKPVATVMGEVGWTWMREKHARLILKSKGYANIVSLKRDAKGIWQGKALRDGVALNVAMDIYGNVKTQPENRGGLAQGSLSY
jgi:hypothetical protein